MIRAHRTARFGWASGTLSSGDDHVATNAKMSMPPARPSSPSVMLTPLLVATMAKAANRM